MRGLSSMWGEIHVGVPQGSILGPLLFSIYMNDLSNVVQTCELNLYADDMEMHCSNANLASAEHDLQRDIQSVNSWLCVNLLTLSIRKSNVMLIGSHQKLRNHDLCVTVDGKQLSCVSSIRYLGLHIDENLLWHQVLFKELTLGYIVLTVYVPSLLTFLLNYIVYVLPILDYCDVVWTPSSVQHFKHLERLHSKFNSPPSSTDFSVRVTLTERRWFHAAIQVYIYRVLSPSYLHDTFHYAVDITSHTGRNLYRLFVPRVRTTLAKHSFYFRGTQIWISLNPILYATRKLEQFKSVYQSLY